MTVTDVTYPENATVLVNIANNATGTVKVYVNNTYIGSYDVINGVARVNLTRYAGGVYNVTVEYLSSDDYNTNITASNNRDNHSQW